MFYVHAFTTDGDEYVHHHKTNILSMDKHEALKSGLRMLNLLHSTFKHEIIFVTMENKEVQIEETPCNGVMLLSAGIPFCFFVPNVQLEESPIMYDPSLPTAYRVSVVPEC